MKHNIIFAALICAGLIVAWHVMPFPTPEIIPDEPEVEFVTPGTCR